jgi:hypothetical protein
MFSRFDRDSTGGNNTDIKKDKEEENGKTRIKRADGFHFRKTSPSHKERGQ